MVSHSVCLYLQLKKISFLFENAFSQTWLLSAGGGVGGGGWGGDVHE